MPKLHPEKLEISRLWTVSTCHIASHDGELLSQLNEPLIAYEYPEGWWLWVPEEYYGKLDLAQLEELGFSPAIGHLLSIAQDTHIEWIRLDADGPKYDFLDTFHW